MTEYLRAATFNLKSPGFLPGAHSWKHRRDLLWRVFRELDADVVGVQELTPRMRSDFLDELGEYNLVGLGRGGPILDEHSDIAVRSGIKVDFESTFRLSKNRSGRIFSFLSPLAWIFPRICTVAELRVGPSRIRVFNTHLDVSSEAARIIQLRMICHRIADYAESDPLPTLLMGDFNSLPNSKTIRMLEEGFGFEGVKLRSVTGKLTGGTYHSFQGGEGRRLIDYIFAGPEFSPIESRIIRSSQDGSYPSDHYPLLTTLRLEI